MNEEDVKMIVFALAESVASRLRRHGFKCKTVAIHVRNNELFSFERQGKMPLPSFLSSEIARRAMELFRQNNHWDKPIRSIGVRGADLVTASGLGQLDLFETNREEPEALERTVDKLRERFGPYSVQSVRFCRIRG